MGGPAKPRCVVVACAILAFATTASADTLYLKNGMYIVVARATEKDGQVEYWVGSTKYTISKTLVTRIEPGNGPPVSSHSANRTLPAVQDLSHRDPDPTTANAEAQQAADARSGRTKTKRTLLGGFARPDPPG